MLGFLILHHSANQKGCLCIFSSEDGIDPPGKKKGTIEKLDPKYSEPQEFGMGLMEYVEGGAPLKGVQWLNKMGRKYGPETIATVEKASSKYWKYSAEVAGRNGKTIYTKYLNMEGKTVQWFHDSYNASNKFLHREFNATGGRLKMWWDGTKEYIKKF